MVIFIEITLFTVFLFLVFSIGSYYNINPATFYNICNSCITDASGTNICNYLQKMYQNYNKHYELINDSIFFLIQNNKIKDILHCLIFLTAGKCTMFSIVEMVHHHKPTRDHRLRKLQQSYISNLIKAYNQAHSIDCNFF